MSEYDHLCEGIVNEMIPHPESDTKFIQCSHETAWEFECPEGTHFDPEQQKCI